jgi:hypothetical protein
MLHLEYMVRYRQEELRREAARYQLINLVKNSSSRSKNFYNPVLTWLGGRLCKWGNLLQERFGEAETVTPCHAMKNSF